MVVLHFSRSQPDRDSASRKLLNVDRRIVRNCGSADETGHRVRAPCPLNYHFCRPVVTAGPSAAEGGGRDSEAVPDGSAGRQSWADGGGVRMVLVGI